MYQNGDSTPSLASQYKCSAADIWWILRKNDIRTRPRKKYVHNQNAFLKITRESAYWLGFLFADGCVSRNTIILQLSEDDLEHVEALRSFLGSNHPIKLSYNGGLGKYGVINSARRKRVARLAITSKTLVRDLSLLNMRQGSNETRLAPGVLAISPDFWRGVIDGDGWIGSYNTAQLGLCGFQPLLEQYAVFVRSLSPEAPARILNEPDTINLKKVCVSGNRAIPVIDALYADAPISLTRKRQKALAILARI